MSDAVPHCVIYRIEAAVYEKRADGSYHPTSKHTVKEMVISEPGNLKKSIAHVVDTIKKVKQ